MKTSNRISAPHGKIADHVKEKARFAHLRNSNNTAYSLFGLPADSPGATIAFMDEGDNYYAGVAYCNPVDNFSKATGRVKSTGRLTQAVLGTGDDDEYGSLYFSGTKEENGDFKSFKATVINDVAFNGGYDVLPGPKKRK